MANSVPPWRSVRDHSGLRKPTEKRNTLTHAGAATSAVFVERDQQASATIIHQMEPTMSHSLEGRGRNQAVCRDVHETGVPARPLPTGPQRFSRTRRQRGEMDSTSAGWTGSRCGLKKG
jgi:hypothetical protein